MPSPQQSPINLRDPIAADLGGKGLTVRYKGKASGLVVKEKDGAKVQFFPPYSQQISLGGPPTGWRRSTSTTRAST